MKLYEIEFMTDIDDYKRHGCTPFFDQTLCRSYRAALICLKYEIENRSEYALSEYNNAVKQYPDYFHSLKDDDDIPYIKRVKDNIEFENRLKKIYEISSKGNYIANTWTWVIREIDNKLDIFEGNEDNIKYDSNGVELSDSDN